MRDALCEATVLRSERVVYVLSQLGDVVGRGRRAEVHTTCRASWVMGQAVDARRHAACRGGVARLFGQRGQAHADSWAQLGYLIQQREGASFARDALHDVGEVRHLGVECGVLVEVSVGIPTLEQRDAVRGRGPPVGRR